MMRKKERLSRSEFNRFFSLGKRHHTPLFQLVYTPHTGLHASVVVSKKIEPHAVGRNKLRRRVYESIRTYAQNQKITGVFIFIMKQESTYLPYRTLKEGLVDAVGRVVKLY